MTRMDATENQSTDPTPDFQTSESECLIIEIKCGAVCPDCHLGILDYNGLLNLVCPTCSFTAGGCFT